MRPLGFLLLLCVLVTLQFQASGFSVRRPGCPIPSYSGCQTVQDQCQVDSHCGFSQKCCTNGCNFVCSFAEGLTHLYNPFIYGAFGPFKNLFPGSSMAAYEQVNPFVCCHGAIRIGKLRGYVKLVLPLWRQVVKTQFTKFYFSKPTFQLLD